MNLTKRGQRKSDVNQRFSQSKMTGSFEGKMVKTAIPATFNLELFDNSDESQSSHEKQDEIYVEKRSSDEQSDDSSLMESMQQQAITPTGHEPGPTRNFHTRRHALDAGGASHLRTYMKRRKNSLVQRVMGYNYDDNSTAGGLYIRVGIGVFCLGTVIHSGLAIFSNLENFPCIRWTAVLDDSCRLLFCFIQFFFIFKHSNLIIRAHEGLARLAVMHIVVTNLCVWFRMVVIETKSQIMEMGGNESNMDTNHQGHKSSHDLHHLSNCVGENNHGSHMTALVHEGYMRLKPLLYPCTIEFSLMCLTLFFLIWENIGKTFTYKMSDKASTKNVFMVNCHASIKGLFSGMIIFSATAISIILYAVFRNKIADDQHSAIMVAHALIPGHIPANFRTNAHFNATMSPKLTYSENLSQSILPYSQTHVGAGPFISLSETPKRLLYSIAIVEIVNLILLCISMFATTWAMFKIRKFQYRRTTTRFDDVLIIVSLTGTYLYTLFSAFALLNNKYPLTWIAYLKVAIVILEFIESTIHAFFILLALRKRLPRRQQNMYPGREVITLLIILDLSLWFEETTTTTKHEANPFQLAFYHIIPWSIIAAIATPLQIFFRFHASVCLSHVWENMYIFPVYEPVAPHGL